MDKIPQRRLLIVISTLMLIIIPAIPGCSDKEQKAPAETNAPAEQVKAEKEPIKNSQNPTVERVMDISDNPAFFKAENIDPNTPSAKELDSIFRPVFSEFFGSAKLAASGKSEAGDSSRQYILESLTYVVRRLFDKKDADDLHTSLLAKGFNASPRYGKKPIHGRTNVAMSLSKTIEQRRYSLAIQLDLNAQLIYVQSLKPDSNLDQW